MENLRNKSKLNKEYFKRFIKLNIYSFTKEGRIYLGAIPSEVYSLFNGNTSTIKKEIGKDFNNDSDVISIDQSCIQYYIILALQDFYQNYYIPLAEENKVLKDDIKMLQLMMKDIKKKNNDRFNYITELLNKK